MVFTLIFFAVVVVVVSSVVERVEEYEDQPVPDPLFDSEGKRPQ